VRYRRAGGMLSDGERTFVVAAWVLSVLVYFSAMSISAL